MNRVRCMLTIVVLVITSSLVTGCWDRIEIEERGTILALAMDPIGEGVTDNMTGQYAKSDVPGYKITAQLAIPGRIPLGPGGGTTGGTSSAKPVWVISATGRTVDDAMNALQKQVAERLFFGQLRIIIVNQQIAKLGMNDVQDFFHRNAEIRRLAWLLVSTGDASEAMAAQPKLERVPTLYLVSSLDQAVKLGTMPNVFLGNFWSMYHSKGREPVLPLISVKGEDQIQLEGLAVFKSDKMVDTLSPLQVASYLELINARRAGYAVSVPMPGDAKHSVVLKGTNRKTRIKFHFQQGKPTFDVYSRMEANVEEKTGVNDVDAVFDDLEKEVSTALTIGQQQVLEKIKQHNADIVGFGEYVRGKNPAYWSSIGTKDRWEEQFPQIPVRLHVTVFIRRSGMSAH